MGILPYPVSRDGIRRVVQEKFGGYCHRPEAGDGVIFDMKNMWGGSFPAAASRPPRKKLRLFPEGSAVTRQYFDFCAWDGVFYLLGYVQSEGAIVYTLSKFDPASMTSPEVIPGWSFESETLAVSLRTWVKLSDRLIIFPDGVVYDRASGTVDTVECSVTVTGAVFLDGSYAGVSATANTVKISGVSLGFRAGDGVTISGCTVHPENNMSLVLREVSEKAGYTYLSFYDNTFTVGTDGSYTETGEVTVARTLPADSAVEGAFECGGRVWAWGGGYIYASKVDDVYNWNVFDGLTSDSWAVECPGGGKLSAGCAYLGYPTFFKEDGIYRVYGSDASEFRVVSTQCPGVREGGELSLAQAGGYLFYHSKNGIMRYSGGMPSPVYRDFGALRFLHSWGGSDGMRYYVRLSNSSGAAASVTYMYDTELGQWYCYDTLAYQRFSWDGNLWGMSNYGDIYLMGVSVGDTLGVLEADEAPQVSEIVFTDFTSGSVSRKGISKLLFRVVLEAGSSVTAYLRLNGTGEWMKAGEASASSAAKRTVSLPVIPRRCDSFSVKLTAAGSWKLLALSYEAYEGSDRH